MILEQVILQVLPEQREAFEEAFDEAKSLIARAPGFLGLSLSRDVHGTATYLLLVEWESIEDHTEGFRKSADYGLWSDLLHRFYDPFPTVAHYLPITHA